MKLPPFRWPSISTPHPDAPLPALWRRLLWMVGIWAGSSAALLAIAMLLRFVLRQ